MKQRDSKILEAIGKDDGGWSKHSDFHWSRNVNGKRLDYWPSQEKFQYEGKIRHSDVYQFIQRFEKRSK